MVKYYIHDLKNHKYIPFESKAELADWWIRRFGRTNFDELNVTGNDTFAVRLYNCDYTYFERLVSLRRYMILDAETGRSIDIRNWHIERFERIHRQYNWPIYNGSKNHLHRKGTAPMVRRTVRAEECVNDEYCTEDLCAIDFGNVLKRLQAKPSHFAGFDPWYFCDKAHANDYSSSKCWKDQSKSPKQYWKHKKGFGKMQREEQEISLEGDREEEGEKAEEAWPEYDGS